MGIHSVAAAPVRCLGIVHISVYGSALRGRKGYRAGLLLCTTMSIRETQVSCLVCTGALRDRCPRRGVGSFRDAGLRREQGSSRHASDTSLHLILSCGAVESSGIYGSKQWSTIEQLVKCVLSAFSVDYLKLLLLQEVGRKRSCRSSITRCCFDRSVFALCVLLSTHA